MKSQLLKPYSILILLLVLKYTSSGQAILTVDGAKISLGAGASLNTHGISVSNNSMVSVNQSVLKVSGNISSSGSIDVSNGTAEMNGTAAQQLAASAFKEKTIKRLTINNNSEVSVGDTLRVTDVLTIANGTLQTGGLLTLKSTPTATARVAPVTSPAVNPVTGDVIVERFIPAKRAFRFLTPAVNTNGSIKENWMENTNNSSAWSNNNPVENYGTHISGTGGYSNGFDQTQTNNASLFTFNNATQAWLAATNTAAPLKAGHAYRLMVRGSRSTNLNSQTPPPSPTTLRAKGTLVTGTVVLKAPGAGGTLGMPELSGANDGYSFIANPYASPVDWLSIETQDIANTIYIFDPTINGKNGRGGYVSFNRTYGKEGSSNASSRIDNNIQSGQAFFVQTTGPNPSVTFKESDKTGTHRAVYRTPGSQMPKFSLQLLLPLQDRVTEVADGLSAYFSDEFTASLANEDSYKFTNQDENIGILRNGKTLSIEGRQPITHNDTLPLRMWQLTSKEYALKIDLKNFDHNIAAYLEDAFLQTTVTLSNDSTTTIPFNITTDAASLASDRFRVVFKASSTLPLQSINVKAYVKNKGVQVDWATESENNIQKYIVEKSENAQRFVAVGTVKATGNSTSSALYEWLDNSPFGGDNYYRIKYVEKSGEAKYSKVVKVSVESVDRSIFIVQHQGNTQSVTVGLKNVDKGKYSFTLVNNIGQSVYNGTFDHQVPSATHEIKFKSVIQPGVYHLQISGTTITKDVSVFIK